MIKCNGLLCLVLSMLVHPLCATQSPNFEVLITEIFADPTPSHGLPEFEYIELYNNSNAAINLKDYVLNYATSTVSFPAYALAPNQYLIVCRAGNGEPFKKYGAVLELSKFSLLNAGSNLSLSDKVGQLNFEITYSDKWYSKDRDQGFSLEMIDINYPCVEAGNWSSTTSEIGGTPAKPNSISASKPDIQAPTLVSQNQISERIIKLIFSEKIDNDIGKIHFESELKLDSLVLTGNNEITIYLLSKIEKDVLYRFSLFNLSDCSQNVAESIRFSIGNFSPAAVGDVLISEILFNPKNGGYDFVEIINVSKKLINLKSWSLGNLDESNKITNSKIIFQNDFIISPEEVLCFSTDKNSLLDIYERAMKNQIVEVAALPTLNNSSGSIALIDQSNQSQDFFFYTENDFFSELDILDGVSLERKNLNVPSSEASNWTSPSSIYGYATPGFRPEYNNQNDGELAMIVSTEIFSPNGDGAEDKADVTFINMNYPGLCSMDIYNVKGQKIRNLMNNQYLSGGAGLSWDGTDSSGKLLPQGSYIIYASLVSNQRVFEFVKKVVLGFSN